jgi:hypothetical protein
MITLDEYWHATWRALQVALCRRDVEEVTALAGDIIRLASMFRARHHRWKRRRRLDFCAQRVQTDAIEARAGGN